MSSASAPGKVILFGEHAVVYGRPAIAVPVPEVCARATVEKGTQRQGIWIHAPDLEVSHHLGDVVVRGEAAFALEATVRNVLRNLGCPDMPDLTITVTSTVPVASGMGSGAAVATAMVRALAQHLGASLSTEEVSALVFATEVIHHGTPSGIDNTVVSYANPIYFVRSSPIELLHVRRPFNLVIADTGVRSPTRVAVEDVRRSWEADRQRFEAVFDRIGMIAALARRAIETGQSGSLGGLMNQNQELLREIGVSSPELEKLISAALAAGAEGAKLCGAGRGGNMVALVSRNGAGKVAASVRAAGAVQVMTTQVRQTPAPSRSGAGE